MNGCKSIRLLWGFSHGYATNGTSSHFTPQKTSTTTMVAGSMFFVGARVNVSQPMMKNGFAMVHEILILIPSRRKGQNANYFSLGSAKWSFCHIAFPTLYNGFKLTKFAPIWGFLSVFFARTRSNEATVRGGASTFTIKFPPYNSAGWVTG